MRLRTLSTLLSDVLSHLPGAEYERAKCEALAAQVSEQRSHIEDLARRLEYTTRQKDEAEEGEAALTGLRDELADTKAQYEAEKAAHGETQQHLTAAIAERDEARLVARTDHDRKVATAEESAEHWRGFAVERLNLLADMERERDALRARVAELQSGEPVAWRVKTKMLDHFTDIKPQLGADRGVFATPLYAASQPPAFGVEGERFIAVASGQAVFIAADGPVRSIGTRAEAEATIAGTHDPERFELLRVLPADAPVVDVDAIRKVADELTVTHPLAVKLRAAIGEEA